MQWLPQAHQPVPCVAVLTCVAAPCSQRRGTCMQASLTASHRRGAQARHLHAGQPHSLTQAASRLFVPHEPRAWLPAACTGSSGGPAPSGLKALAAASFVCMAARCQIQWHATCLRGRMQAVAHPSSCGWLHCNPAACRRWCTHHHVDGCIAIRPHAGGGAPIIMWMVALQSIGHAPIHVSAACTRPP